ncbi:MAG: hypothetical protein AAF682_18865 [Planctomycetota bacterium]
MLARTLLLCVLVLILGCVGSRGFVEVGQPQVHTRERLISERQSRAEWLRTELRASESLQANFQGFRDLRSFAGIYTSLRASIDPEAGDIAAAEAENEKLRLEAERWNLKRQVRDARQGYDDAGAGNPTNESPAPDDPQGYRDPAAPPTGDPVFNVNQGLISPAEAERTKAEQHPLDRFRDRLAMRNAVEAELRETQFDDAHDILGSELYGLTLDLAVLPGDSSSEFVEVDLHVSLARDDEAGADRLQALLNLYHDWLAFLPVRIEREVASWIWRIEELQDELDAIGAAVTEEDDGGETSRSNDAARRSEEQSIDQELRRMALEIFEVVSEERRRVKLLAKYATEEELPPASDSCFEQKLTDLRCRLFLATRDPYWISVDRTVLQRELTLAATQNGGPAGSGEAVENDGADNGDPVPEEGQALQKLGENDPFHELDTPDLLLAAMKRLYSSKARERLAQISRKGPDDEDRRNARLSNAKRSDFRKLLRLTVARQYQQSLSRLAVIRIDDERNFVHAEEPSADLIKLLGHGEIKASGGEQLCSGLRYQLLDKKDPASSPSLRAFVDRDVDTIDGCMLLGSLEFARILLVAERSLQAYAAQPTELAQSISDVSARETVTSTMVALQAMLPAEGVSADSQLELLRKSQERFHGILRQPLVVGFSRGGSRLGWVLGPKFSLRDGEAEFLHAHARYKVDAAIIVPGWVDKVFVKADAKWIHSRGGKVPGELVWPESDQFANGKIGIRLPQPADIMDRVMLALLSESSLLSQSSRGGLQRRPGPEVDSPGRSERRRLLAPGEQSLLVLGDQLWRNPQVFVGDQKATSVEVLADMSGLLAKFDRLDYPDVRPEDPQADTAIPQDLTVVTTFGVDRVEEAVAIRYDPGPTSSPPKGSSEATLRTSFLEAGSKERILFAFAKPKAFHSVKLELFDPKNSAKGELSGNKVGWDSEGKVLTVQAAGADWPNGAGARRLVDLQLLRFDRADQTTGTRVTPKERPKLALFPGKKERAFLAPAAGSNGELATEFTRAGSLPGERGIVLELEESAVPIFDVAYPGLFSTVAAGDLILELADTDVVLPLVRLEAKSGKYRMEVPKQALVDARKKLVKEAKATPRTAQLVYVGDDEGKAGRIVVPVYKGTNAVKLKFDQQQSDAGLTLLSDSVELPFRGRTARGLRTPDGKERLKLFQLDAAAKDLDENYPGWNRGGSVTVDFPGYGPTLVLDLLGSKGEAHTFGLLVPLGQDAALAAATVGKKAPSVKVGDKALTVASPSGAKVEFTVPDEASFTLAQASLTKPASGQVLIRFTLAADQQRNLKTDVLGRSLELRLTPTSGGSGTTREATATLTEDGSEIRCDFPLPAADALWPASGQSAVFDLALRLDDVTFQLSATQLTLQ